MNLENFIKRYREEIKGSEITITDEELIKIYIGLLVLEEERTDMAKKEKKRIKSQN